MNDKKNLLFISSHLPSEKIPQAGQKIALDILRNHSDEYNVFLVSFYNNFEKKYLDKKTYEFCRETYLFHISNLNKLMAIATHISSPLKSVVRVHKKAENKIAELQSRINFDVVHFYFTEASYYLKLFNNSPTHSIITQIDVCYQAIDRKRKVAPIFSKFLYDFEYKRQKKWELEVLNKSDSITVLNSKDKNILVNDGIPDNKITIIKPLISESFKQISRNHIEKNTILFWGAMNRNENVDAVKWFLKEIFPRICAIFPDAKLYIVGANPPREIVKLQSSNIAITGFVDNPLQFFEKCHVAVAPLRLGAGIKIKVLEYLEAGLPVVATPVGAEGIEHKNLVVVDQAADFSRAVLKLFEEPLTEGNFL